MQSGNNRFEVHSQISGARFSLERYALGVYNEICQALCGLVGETAE